MSKLIRSAQRHNAARVPVKTRIALAIGALGMFTILGQALPAAAGTLPQHPCTPELARLMAEWNEAGFQMPSKPTQPIVHGRNGRVSSGPEVTYMASQIRQAVIDCQNGNVPGVRQHIASAETVLNRQG